MQCYTAVVELDSPESVQHAVAILDFHAAQHPAIAQPQPRTGTFTITLPADTPDHANHMVNALLRITGYRPLQVVVMPSEDYDRRVKD